MDVVVEAWDHDPLNSPDPIARYRGNLVVVETPNTASTFHMVREDFQHINKFRYNLPLNLRQCTSRHLFRLN